MKFSADEMLGKLARWLRMAGLDVHYERQVLDTDLVQRARREKRILLTRDTRLIKTLLNEESLFISEDHLEDQIKELYVRFPELLKELHPLSRCVECNTALISIEKDKVKDRVWPYVYETQNNFTTCPTCNRVYWQATHVKKIKEKLKRMKLANLADTR